MSPPTELGMGEKVARAFFFLKKKDNKQKYKFQAKQWCLWHLIFNSASAVVLVYLQEG